MRCSTLQSKSEMKRHKKMRQYPRAATDMVKVCYNCECGVFQNINDGKKD